jgi:hypothetical protein
MSVGEFAIDILDAPLDEALLLAGGMVFGVLLEIAVGAGLRDGLDDAGGARCA